jgi:uncharacterized protein YbjQ (UPF0145 family)
MKKIVAVSFLLSSLCAVGCTPPRSAHEAAEKGEHDEEPDPRLEEPSVIRAARNVKVLPGGLTCPTEVLGLVDVHEPVRTTAEGLDLLKRRAVLLGAEAVIGVEFEHGEGGAEKTHLSGTAVRCNDLIRGRKYDVIGKIEVSAEMEHEDDALRQLKSRATAQGANLIVGVKFEHGEGDRTKLTGTAVHAYYPSEASR